MSIFSMGHWIGHICLIEATLLVVLSNAVGALGMNSTAVSSIVPESINGESSSGYNNMLILSVRNVLFAPAIAFVLFVVVSLYLLLLEIFYYKDAEYEDEEDSYVMDPRHDKDSRQTDIECPHHSQRSNNGRSAHSGGEASEDPTAPVLILSPSQQVNRRLSQQVENHSDMDDAHADMDVEGGDTMFHRAEQTPGGDSDQMVISGTNPMSSHKKIPTNSLKTETLPEQEMSHFDDGVSSLSDPLIDSSLSSSGSSDDLEAIAAIHEYADIPIGTTPKGQKNYKSSDGYKQMNTATATARKMSFDDECDAKEVSPHRVLGMPAERKSTVVKIRPSMAAGFTGNIALAGNHRASVKKDFNNNDFEGSPVGTDATDHSKGLKLESESGSATGSVSPIVLPGIELGSTDNHKVIDDSPVEQHKPAPKENEESTHKECAVTAVMSPTNTNRAALRSRPSMTSGFVGGVSLTSSRRSLILTSFSSNDGADHEKFQTEELAVIPDTSALDSSAGVPVADKNEASNVPITDEGADIAPDNTAEANTLVDAITVDVASEGFLMAVKEDNAIASVCGVDGQVADNHNELSAETHDELPKYNDTGSKTEVRNDLPVLIDTETRDTTETTANPVEPVEPMEPEDAPTQEEIIKSPPPQSPSNWRRPSLSPMSSNPMMNSPGGNSWRRSSIGSASFGQSLAPPPVPGRAAPASPAIRSRIPPALPSSPSSWRRGNLGGVGAVSNQSIGSVISIGSFGDESSPSSPPDSRSSSAAVTPPPVPPRRVVKRPPPTVPDVIVEDPPAVAMAVAEISADGSYSYADLRNGVPPGVDKTAKESHLSYKEFLTVFGMTKEAFYALPKWRQSTLKKDNGLY